VPLGRREVGNIIQRGGTVLGTSRCEDFHTPEGRAIAAADRCPRRPGRRRLLSRRPRPGPRVRHPRHRHPLHDRQ
jgi:hypothetical protein